MTRETHSGGLRYRAVLIALLLVASPLGMPLLYTGFGDGTVRAADTVGVEGDFTEYDDGTVAPGPWDGGTVDGSQDSLHVGTTSTAVHTESSFYLENVSGRFVASGTGEVRLSTQSTSPHYAFELRPSSNSVHLSTNDGSTVQSLDINMDFSSSDRIEFDFTRDSGDATLTATNLESGETGSVTQSDYFPTGTDQLAVDTDSDASDSGTVDLYEYRINNGQPDATGTVVDENGTAIEGATVTFTDTTSGDETTTQTEPDGTFAAEIETGEYEISISKDGYQAISETRVISEGDNLGTFELARSQLDLQFTRYVPPDNSTPYEVEFVADDGTTEDVTANVSMNSSNTSIATANTTTTEIVGAEGVNGTSVITATYTVGNETFTTTRTVTVATKTVDNLEILPGTWRFSAVMDDITMQVLLVAIGAGIVATHASTSWAGLGAMELVLIIGWFADWVPIGIAMLGLFTALFIGLNLAANIDYSVRR